MPGNDGCRKNILKDVIEKNEDWLTERVLFFATELGYVQYVSPLKDAWRMSVAGLSQAFLDALDKYDDIPDFSPTENFSEDPAAAFGMLEARRHRDRGINLGMFLGLFKYYRQSYLSLLNEKGPEECRDSRCRLFIERFFDRVELGLCVEWVSKTKAQYLEEMQERAQQYQALFENNHSIMLLIDPKTASIVDANLAACRFYGYSKEEITRKKISEINTLPEEKVFEEMRAAQTEQRQCFYFGHQIASGEVRDVEVYCGPIVVQGRSLLYSIVHDITQRKKIENELRKISEALEHSPASVVITDAQANIEYVNRKFTEITGYSSEEVMGENPRILQSGNTPPETFQKLWSTILSGKEWRGEFLNKKKNGTPFWEEASISPIFDESGKITHFVAVKEDITERKKLQEKILRQANYDMLTGLPNRSLFQDRLQQAMKQADRGEHMVALMFIDLDRFKEVNDTLGHDIGDQLLKQAGWRLSDCVRKSDTVARMGGDEFTVILNWVKDVEAIEVVAEKILESLSQLFRVDGAELKVSGSIGIALYPRDGDTVTNLLKNADVAMYRAKDSGRNTFRFYSGK